jgi:hypothetical protein
MSGKNRTGRFPFAGSHSPDEVAAETELQLLPKNKWRGLMLEKNRAAHPQDIEEIFMSSALRLLTAFFCTSKRRR